MLSLELITKYQSVLDNDQLSKTESIELINLLKESKEIQLAVKEIQRKVIELINSGTINKYVELNGQLYCLESGNIYSPIPVDSPNAKEFLDLEEEIIEANQKLSDYITNEQQRIDDLYFKKEEYIRQLSAEFMATDNTSDGYILVNKENNLYKVISV